jgi:cysteine desulfurase
MHANNETGVVQPIAEIAGVAHNAGAVVHTDAAQSVGKVSVHVRELGVDLLSIAGHKLYAPKGVGALYVRRGTPLLPLALGAGHERGLLWEDLCGRVPGIAMNGHRVERLPNTLSVRFPGVSGTALLVAAPGLAASTGSACHRGQEQAPPVVVAMGVPPQEALGTVRLTLGRGSTEEDVRRASAALAAAWRAVSRGFQAVVNVKNIP